MNNPPGLNREYDLHLSIKDEYDKYIYNSGGIQCTTRPADRGG